MVTGPGREDDAQRVDALVGELSSAFPQTPAEQVRHVVLDTWQEFLGAPVREFVPLLVRRRAISRLRVV
jgi:hypothetical protein